MPVPAQYPAIHSQAGNLFEALQAFDGEVTNDAQNDVAAGYADYAVANTKTFLTRAGTLLKKEGYTMCVAGTFSSGKSTFINALLGEPELLPSAAGECTLSITVVRAPGPGEPERVVVDYFTRDEAVTNVVFHQKAYRNAFKRYEKDLKGAGADEMLGVIKKVIAWLPTAANDQSVDADLREEYAEGKAKEYADQLKEFVTYLDKCQNRLGSSHVDHQVAQASQYLTVDAQKRGIGHLFLISKVTIFRNNPLFVEKGLEIIDTPGTDSPSPRQRQITHEFLEKADVVVSVLEPRGFTMANMEIIETMTRANLGNIRNKMFFVVNKFDTMDSASYRRDQLESLMKNDFYGRIVQNKLNPKHIYLTVALVDVERAKGNDKEVESVLKYCKSKLDLVDPNTDEPWKTKTIDALSGKGIEVMRKALLRYLEEELAFERIRDIQRSLAVPLNAGRALVNANRGLIEQARSGRSTAIGRMRDFILKTQAALEVNLIQLANGIPGIIGQVMGSKLKPKIVETIKRFEKIPLSDPAKQVAFTGATAKLQTPAGVKQLWIDFTKINFSDQFVALVADNLVGPVQNLIDQQVAGSNVDKILEHLSGISDQDLVGPLKAAIGQAKQNVEIITRLRADEATWTLRKAEIHPQGFEAAWTPQIEQKFKADMIAHYTGAFTGFCDQVAAVLGVYYQVIVNRLIEQFKARADELETALKNSDSLDLPVHLLTNETPDPNETKRRRLLVYADVFERASKADSELTKALAD